MGWYTLLQLDSNDVAGLYTLNDDQKQQGVPPHWLSYVLVEDADASANKATELGGKVMMGPFDVPNVGRMAIVHDPTGAVFALFQAGEHKGTVPMGNKPGMFCWNELATRDPDAAKAFYSGLFGWTSEESDIGHTIRGTKTALVLRPECSRSPWGPIRGTKTALVLRPECSRSPNRWVTCPRTGWFTSPSMIATAPSKRPNEPEQTSSCRPPTSLTWDGSRCSRIPRVRPSR